MEGAADLQRQAAAGAFFLCQSRRGLHGGLLTAEDQLAGAVVVGDDHAAVGGGLVTGLLQGRPVQPQHRYHGRGPSGCGFLHGFAAEGHQLHGGVGVKDPGGMEGGILTQRQSGGSGGDDAPLRQQRGHACGEGHHAGLGVASLIQNALRVGEGDLLQIEIHLLRGAVQYGAEGGEALIQVSAHAGVLAALSRV